MDAHILLYHAEIFIPQDLIFPRGILYLYPTNHAYRAARNDRYGEIEIPETINVELATLIEVETRNNKITKLVYRAEYDDDYDLTVVIRPNHNDVWDLITMWLNAWDDTHVTLNFNKYICQNYKECV